MYKVEFNKSELHDPNIPKSSRCILAISMGVEAYEKHKLIGILKLINRNFQECIIVVGDTLNRYNAALQQQGGDLEALTLKQGEDWLNRNLAYFVKELQIPFKVIRWNSFLSLPNFEMHSKKIEHLYQTNDNYRTVFDDTAEEFINRQGHPDNSKNSHHFHQCIKYLKEEAAVMCLWTELNCEYEIYYNKRNGVMDLIYQDLLKPAYPDLLQPISLRFKRKKDVLHVREVLDSFTLKNIVETLPGHIFWKNKDGVYLGCNMQQALYYGAKSPEDVINKTDHDLLDKDAADKIRRNDLKIMKENKHVIVEEENNGDYFLSSKSSIKDHDGRSIGIMGCAINITKQKTLERKLKIQTEVLNEAVGTKDRFLNNLSHEIRTPIHIISAITNELHDQYYQLSDDEKLEFIKLLQGSTQKVSKLIKNMLSLAKGKKGNLVVRLEKTNMVELVQSVIEEILVISPSGISFVPSDQIIYVNCTKYQIEQVVRNLLENAIKYGQNKPITVNVNGTEQDVRVEVVDEGIAVPKDEKVKIFEAFEESSRTKNIAGGTGLGLAICRDIIDLHNGKIWVESDGNIGSKFIFTLPN